MYIRYMHVNCVTNCKYTTNGKKYTFHFKFDLLAVIIYFSPISSVSGWDIVNLNVQQHVTEYVDLFKTCE